MTKKPTLGIFLKIFMSKTGALASGALSVVAAGLGLWISVFPAKLLFLLVAFVAASGAAYQLWAEERSARIAAEAYLERPDLSIDIQGCFRAMNSSWLLLYVAVVNRSIAASTVQRFKCSISGPFGTLEDRGSTDVSAINPFLVRNADTGETVNHLYETTDLIAALRQNALERGRHAEGYMQFSFSELPRDVDEVFVNIRLTDSLGNIHQEGDTIAYKKNAWIY